MNKGPDAGARITYKALIVATGLRDRWSGRQGPK